MQTRFPKVVLAPMAGITDRPFRELCRRFGAEAATSEMVSSNPVLRNTNKSQRRLDRQGEMGLQIVQIAGTDPQIMANLHAIMSIMVPRLSTSICVVRQKKSAMS